ncbi:hypothetical protein HPB50_011631 [Hyalomma asiaticum]|uniref:Uncharacterized protein n=1 Tax=Hyalomma asiaticum TaxID=266040 RepID=A0ACB7SK46_HYAAI|nr:hypothetical protein HPB50_011631 [Hyalomma asiaticum]
MQLDTQASVSVMARKLFKQIFAGVSAQASSVTQCSYCGELSQVEGQAQVNFRFGIRGQPLPLYNQWFVTDPDSSPTVRHR